MLGNDLLKLVIQMPPIFEAIIKAIGDDFKEPKIQQHILAKFVL